MFAASALRARRNRLSWRRASRLRAAALALAAVTATAITGCGGSAAAAPAVRTTYGAPVAVGDGEARVYLVAEGDAPVEIGVALSERALAGLPTDGAPGGMAMPDGHHTYDFVLPMPEGNPTAYRFVGLGWNPAGHEPPGIYDRPHFDFHFYAMTEVERAAIVPNDPEYEAKSAHEPAAELVPAGYVRIPGAVPLMGAHWVDPKTPELNGKPFTETFLYGSWGGKLTFAEPMITAAFLESKPDHREPIAVPERYETAGWYPTEYRVYWDEESREYRVALSGLERSS